MEKFNYKVTIEAPSKEIADMLMNFICKDNIEIIQLFKGADEKKETKEKEEEKDFINRKKILTLLEEAESFIDWMKGMVLEESFFSFLNKTKNQFEKSKTT